ncbi:MAG: hypothetical protein R3F59_18755 [Myxococcota bacterium]
MRRWPMAVVLLAAGCAYRGVGFIETMDDRTILREADGDEVPLALDEAMAPVSHLGEHLVEVLGRRGLGRVRVEAWRALEGPHGFPVWVGPVQRSDRRVGIANVSQQTVTWVDDDAAPELAPYMGDPVAAEGYLEDGRLHVVDWVPLVDGPRSGAFRP